jgi:hypothetical protein
MIAAVDAPARQAPLLMRMGISTAEHNRRDPVSIPLADARVRARREAQCRLPDASEARTASDALEERAAAVMQAQAGQAATVNAQAEGSDDQHGM